MNRRFLIIADDVTGSCDSGLQAAKKGITSKVIFSDNLNSTQILQKETELLIIDTETRIMEGQKAFELISKQFHGFDFSQYNIIVKKTDSTLRGNCAKEIRAIDNLYKSSLIFFIPALPTLGRTTVNEIQLLNGIPLLQTEFAYDPITPLTQDNIRLMLQTEFAETVCHISLEQLRSDDFVLPPGRIFTCDAQTVSDMQKAVFLVRASKKQRILWAGSAGIADSLFQIENKTKPAFAIVASMSSVSARQVAHAAQNGAVVVAVPAEKIASESENKNSEQLLADYAQQILLHLRQNTDVILASDAVCPDKHKTNRGKKNCDTTQQSTRTAAVFKNFLAAVACRVLQTQAVSGLFLTGGDTAAGFCKAAGITALHITTEIASGIPQLIAEGGQFDGLKIITKAGSFGNEETITFALSKLKETAHKAQANSRRNQ